MIGNVQKAKSVNILLVGNNPIELTAMLHTIKQLPIKNVVAEIAFDLTSIGQRLLNFKPNYILIDDNIGVLELTQAVKKLSTNPKTRDVPITILKNSNFTASLASNDVADYLLKPQLTPDSIIALLKNSLRFTETRKYLASAYAKRKKLLSALRN